MNKEIRKKHNKQKMFPREICFKKKDCKSIKVLVLQLHAKKHPLKRNDVEQ